MVNHGKSLGKGIAAGAAAKVTYRLGDTVSTTQMNDQPGDRIPVKDGKLVLNPPVAQK